MGRHVSPIGSAAIICAAVGIAGGSLRTAAFVPRPALGRSPGSAPTATSMATFPEISLIGGLSCRAKSREAVMAFPAALAATAAN